MGFVKRRVIFIAIVLILVFTIFFIRQVVFTKNQGNFFTGNIILNEGETLRFLDPPKTNLICISGGYDQESQVENYDEMFELPTREEIVGGAVLSRTSIKDYNATGVIQVVQDLEGNTLREIPTTCTCRVSTISYNRYFHSGDNNRYSTAELSCIEISETLIPNENCEMYMGEFINVIKLLEENCDKDLDYKPVAKDVMLALSIDAYSENLKRGWLRYLLSNIDKTNHEAILNCADKIDVLRDRRLAHSKAKKVCDSTGEPINMYHVGLGPSILGPGQGIYDLFKGIYIRLVLRESGLGGSNIQNRRGNEIARIIRGKDLTKPYSQVLEEMFQ